jgi:hypothetical protein
MEFEMHRYFVVVTKQFSYCVWSLEGVRPSDQIRCSNNGVDRNWLLSVVPMARERITSWNNLTSLLTALVEWLWSVLSKRIMARLTSVWTLPLHLFARQYSHSQYVFFRRSIDRVVMSIQNEQPFVLLSCRNCKWWHVRMGIIDGFPFSYIFLHFQ